MCVKVRSASAKAAILDWNPHQAASHRAGGRVGRGGKAPSALPRRGSDEPRAGPTGTTVVSSKAAEEEHGFSRRANANRGNVERSQRTAGFRWSYFATIRSAKEGGSVKLSELMHSWGAT